MDGWQNSKMISLSLSMAHYHCNKSIKKLVISQLINSTQHVEYIIIVTKNAKKKKLRLKK